MAVKSSLGNMVICLGSITLVCALLLAVVYAVTMKPIVDAQNDKENQAIATVSPEFESLKKGTTDEGNEYYITMNNSGDTLCYVVKASSAGFGGSLDIMAGFLPDGKIYRTAVLAQNETPGLGAKCCEEPFIGQFAGFDVSTRKLEVKQDGGDVDAITAATITSRAFCVALNNAYQIFGMLKPSEAPADSLNVDAVTAVSNSTSQADRVVTDTVSVERGRHPHHNREMNRNRRRGNNE